MPFIQNTDEDRKAMLGAIGVDTVEQLFEDIPADIRAAARKEASSDPDAVHARLAAADPVTAARINPADTQRLARALEVWRATGIVPSEALGAKRTPPDGLAFHHLTIMPERQTLYDRINRRAALMAEMGAEEEAMAFLERGLAETLPAMKAVGLREFGAAGRNEITECLLAGD